MAKRIVVIQGHPDPAGGHYGHALADAYVRGAEEAGHEVRRLDVARIELPLLRTKEDFETGTPPAAVKPSQDAIAWAGHIVLLYPLWMGTMPAVLKAYLEQVFRPDFAFGIKDGGRPTKPLKGKSARIVVTMGMPAWIYRWYFRAHSLKSLERNILGFCGIAPIRESLVGSVESPDQAHRSRWLERLHGHGWAGR